MPGIEKKEEKSYLEKALLLSEAGGIYFEGARVDNDPRTIFLFVGLGGTGADALIRTKNQIANRMKLPMDPVTGLPVAKLPSNVAFLEFDTDVSAQKKTAGNTGFAPHNQEFCPLTVAALAPVIAHHKREKANGVEQWKWLDDDLTANGGSDGAGGIRQVGRLLLFEHADDVVARLNQCITNLATNNPVACNLQIILFSGISGGTGSGTTIDMGYICRTIGQAKMASCNVLGYFVMSDLNESRGGQTEMLRRNCYSVLKELDALQLAGNRDKLFHQKYSNNFTIDTIEPPFNHVHLINGSDTAGHIFTYDTVMDTIAENVFCYVAGETSGDAPAMKSLYDNVNAQYLTIENNGAYPANYRYLSVGASSLKIPYTEISTLLACRLFGRLEQTIFQQIPNDKSFNNFDLRDLGINEQHFIDFLVKKNPPRPSLTRDKWKYDDIWKQGDRPWRTFYAEGAYFANVQSEMTARMGQAPGEFEGRFTAFMSDNIANKERGPIYIARMLESNENPSLLPSLREWKRRFHSIANQAIERQSTLEAARAEAYDMGLHPGIGGKGRATDNYLSALGRCVMNDETIELYTRMEKLATRLIERLEMHHRFVFKPLADTLEALPIIFRKNLQYLKDKADKEARNPDPSILITPFKFEADYRGNFTGCVDRAELNFLKTLKDNIKLWIGRDLNDVSDSITGNEDVVGFLSRYISDSFNGLYTTTSMQSIMNTSKGTDTLTAYVFKQLATLFNSSYSMYKTAAGAPVRTQDFYILSVPSSSTAVITAAKDYIDRAAIPSVIIKTSTEQNCMYIVKVTAGMPLHANAFIKDLETVYDNQMDGPANAHAGLHLRPEFADLPSPYVEASWNGYESRRTKVRNERYRNAFNRCWMEGTVWRPENEYYCLLSLADERVNLAGVTLSGTTAQKKAQLAQVTRRLWDKANDDRSVKLNKCSTYCQGKPDEAVTNMDDAVQNIREACLLHPDICEQLEQQCKILDQIRVMSDTLENPAYYARVIICQLLKIDPATKDISLIRYPGDPMPKELISGLDYNLNEYDGQYKVYLSLKELLDSSNNGEDSVEKWREIINNNLTNTLKMYHANPTVLGQFRAAVQNQANMFLRMKQLVEQQAAFDIGNVRKEKMVVADFYAAVSEEFTRLLG